MALRIGSLEKAAAWVDEAGLAVVYANADLVLPSLWEAVAGPGADWAIRDEHGKATDSTPEFSTLWRWKDELPERKLICAGRHLGRGVASLVAPRLLGALYAQTERAGHPEDFRDSDLEALELELAEAVLENGPCTAPELRRLTGASKRPVDSALGRLQRSLVFTNAVGCRSPTRRGSSSRRRCSASAARSRRPTSRRFCAGAACRRPRCSAN
jgi:hypothetical protein